VAKIHPTGCGIMLTRYHVVRGNAYITSSYKITPISRMNSHAEHRN